MLLVFIASAACAQAPQPATSPQQPAAEGAQTDDRSPNSGRELLCPQGRKRTAEARFANYLIRTYRWPDPEGCLQILKSGVVVYSLVSGDFKIGNNFEGAAPIPIGTDVAGAGKPTAIVTEWSGGAHCCYTLHVFEFSDEFREIARVEAGDSDNANFVELNHDGSYEFEGHDWAFAYWRTCFLCSPAPRIVLKYREGHFRLAFDLMRTPNLSEEEFADTIESVRSDDEWSSRVAPDCVQNCGVPVALWKNMLDLMYGGHADLAWRLLDESWLTTKHGKAAFAGQFCKRLRSSQYWPDLKVMVGPCPRAENP
jgi:hypothetical protein